MKNQDSGAVPGVSVVICTRNRSDKIGSAVASVLANDHPSFDLTVIDQSTDDSTKRQLLALDDQRLTYVHSSEPGLSRAYNNGIGRSTGPIIAFTDDDCLVPVDWIRRIEEAFESEPDGDLLYGKVIPKGDSPEERGLTPWLDIAKPERLSRKDGFKVFGMGANFAARRRLFDRIGGFDEVLGGGGPLRSSQDFDLAYRTYRSGSIILLRPEVTLLHDGQRTSEDWPRLFRDYGVGDGGFYSKHVRCGDPYAMFLLGRQIWHQGIRVIGRPVIGRERRSEYMAGLFYGMKKSFSFKVDRRHKRYALP
jgi:glycosyltransferase involved in cell wall biosynthesis